VFPGHRIYYADTFRVVVDSRWQGEPHSLPLFCYDIGDDNLGSQKTPPLFIWYFATDHCGGHGFQLFLLV